MASIPVNELDPTTDRADDRTPVPVGDYLARIVESDVKPTKAGTGITMPLVWQISDGEHGGRKIFENVNLKNPNAVAMQIGKKQLNSICDAIGVQLRPNDMDSLELHDRECWISVGIEPAKGDYPAKNVINGYHAIQREDAAPASGQVQSAPAPGGQNQSPPVQQRPPVQQSNPVQTSNHRTSTTPASRQPAMAGAAAGGGRAKKPWER